jgi:acyl-CoA synthetase (AMP-forming)/AMP-acid ligase II
VADLDILAVHASARPGDTAVIDGDWTLTLGQLNDLVNRYGNVLRGAGVRAGEKVLWVGMNSAEVVAISHACRKVGAVCVPMNYRLAPEEAAYVIDNCDAVVVCFDLEQAAQLEPVHHDCDRVREWLAFRLQGEHAPRWAADLDALAATAAPPSPTVRATTPPPAPP